MSGNSTPFLILMATCALACTPANAQERQESIVLSTSRTAVRWADVYKVLPERSDDPYFHVRVFEHHKGQAPWAYKELAFHMAVTPKALEASRTNKKAKIYSYKDVEIRMDYHRWLDNPQVRSSVPVCDTDILRCLNPTSP